MVVGETPKLFVVVTRRRVHGPAETLVLVELALFELDARPPGKVHDRLRELQVPGLTEEGDDVAALLAAKTVVEAFVWVDRKRGRTLSVEGAEADKASALLLERDCLADYFDEVKARLDLLDHPLVDFGTPGVVHGQTSSGPS
jgi:hypothetical protein